MDKTKEIQEEILKIFKEFKRICDDNNLRYFAIGGTCIGAVRHKGFIPWDDDLDVAMPIDDYNKFRNIANNELSNDYQLIDYNKDENYALNFLKIQNINTTFIEEVNKNDYLKYKGIYIDIMPICGISKNSFFSTILKYRFLYLNKQNSSVRYGFDTKKSIKAKIHWIISRVILIFSNKFIYMKKWEKLCNKYFLSKDNNVLFVWRIPLRKPYSNTFDYEDFKKSIELPFEDTFIAVPIGYDNYLKKDFGDYMKIPPIEKRHTHNPFVLDLNRSYKEYQELYKNNGTIEGKIYNE